MFSLTEEEEDVFSVFFRTVFNNTMDIHITAFFLSNAQRPYISAFFHWAKRPHTKTLGPWTCKESHANHNQLTVETLTFYFPLLFLSLLKTLVSLAMEGGGEMESNQQACNNYNQSFFHRRYFLCKECNDLYCCRFLYIMIVREDMWKWNVYEYCPVNLTWQLPFPLTTRGRRFALRIHQNKPTPCTSFKCKVCDFVWEQVRNEAHYMDSGQRFRGLVVDVHCRLCLVAICSVLKHCFPVRAGGGRYPNVITWLWCRLDL